MHHAIIKKLQCIKVLTTALMSYILQYKKQKHKYLISNYSSIYKMQYSHAATVIERQLPKQAYNTDAPTNTDNTACVISL